MIADPSPEVVLNRAPTAVRLPDRGVVQVSGADAEALLQGLLTLDLPSLAPGVARLGALLSPQGKVLFDFLVVRAASGEGLGEGVRPEGFPSEGFPSEGFLLDAPAASLDALAKRLSLYRLRADARIADRSRDGPAGPALGVGASWGGAGAPAGVLAARDERAPGLGQRLIGPAVALAALPDGAAPYAAHRAALGVPEGGADYALGETFPHEALLDQLGGVDFRKGCYVGQEVVSRVQHRGTARARIVPVAFAGPPPGPGAEVLAGERAIGRVGTVAGALGLASLRLDRADEALRAGVPLRAEGATLTIRRPAYWISFPLPGEGPAPAGAADG